MTLYTVTIGSDTYEVYGGLTAAKKYIGGMIGDGAVAWAGLADTAAAGTLSRSSLLNSATTFLDAQAWQGTANATGGTTLQWPRDGVTDRNGVAVDSTTVPTNIVNACFELAALAAADTSILVAIDAGTNIRSVAAGSARVENFAPTSAARGTAPLLPVPVQRLVGQYLGVASTGGGFTTAADSDSDDATLSDSRRWDRTWPF